MPLTVQPTKPHLCNDDRFLNLWTQDHPFKLDSVQHLPKYVLPGFFQTVCDDKSVMTISNSLWTPGHFLDLSGVVGFLSIVALCLVENRPLTSITPLASLPLIIYGRLEFLLLCTSTTVTVVNFLSLMVIFQLAIKICPPRVALIWLWPTLLSFLRVLSFPPSAMLLVWKIDFGTLQASPLLRFYLRFGETGLHFIASQESEVSYSSQAGS